jgi:hypothetical protein
MLASLLVALLAAPLSPPVVHDRAYWSAIAGAKYAVPEGVSADALALELADYTASPDPQLRDEYAYSILARWIRRGNVSDPTLRILLAEWTAGMKAGVGETGGDSVLRRSFSALNLSTLAAREVQHPFLTQAEYDALLGASLDYLAAEKDARGYDERKGWMHATAHTADLLAYLALGSRLARGDQARILQAVGARERGTSAVYAFGENERLAGVVDSLVARPDFDAAAFSAFLASVTESASHLWDKAPAIDVPAFAAVQNQKDLLRSLYVSLSQRAEPSPAVEAARAEILKTLKPLE